MAVTMNKKDKDALAAAGAAWNAAKAAGDQAGMEKAHADAEAIRANYGYSGGADGSQNIKLPPSGSGNSGNNQYTGIGKGSEYYAGQKMSKSDQDLLTSYGDKWNAATDPAEKEYWHSQAEALRGQYGYSGGMDGSDFIALAESLGISTGNRPTYKSSYMDRIDAMLDEILNRDKFSYDAADDPLFQQYQTMYNREGSRAMQDTFAAAASGAGGMNSYAITAAQQAGDYYSAQLMDKMPELYQLAYEMYLTDIDNQVRDLGLLQDMDQTQYNRYRDTMSDWENDRNFAYQQYRDDVADSQWQTSFDRGAFESDRDFNYGVSRDQIEDERYEDELAYDRAQDALKGSSSGGSGGKSKPTLTLAQTLDALENGIINETTKAAYEYYYGEPYDDGTDVEPGAEGTVEQVDLSDIQPGVIADIRSRLMELGPSSSDDATRARELLKILNSMASSGLIDADQADRIAAFYGY